MGQETEQSNIAVADATFRQDLQARSPASSGAASPAGSSSPAGMVVPSDSEILATLVTELAKAGRSVAVVEIQGRLPPSLRELAENTDDICRWLRRFPGLLEVAGEPGEEHVMLTIGKPGNTSPGASTGTPSDAPDARSPNSVFTGASAFIGNSTTAARMGVDDDCCLGPSVVQLRGLPFHATIADITTFLAEHAANVPHAGIQLLLNRDGRPSGFARVQFLSPQAATTCREALHRKPMGDRYVEVLACSERTKGRPRRVTEADSQGTGSVAAGASDTASDVVERERILQECREHMCMPGRSQLLLSMLGIALSPPARAYLRRANLGLKHILIRSPHEFRIDGPKGCERVLWCGGMGMDPAAMADLPGFNEAMINPWAAAVPGLLSPDGRQPATPNPPASGNCVETPSDWGTPGPGAPTEDGVGLPASEGTEQAAFDAAAAWGAYAAAWPPWGGPWMPWADGSAGADGMAMGFGGQGAQKGAGKKRNTRADAATTRSHAHLHPQMNPFAASGSPVGGGDDEASKVASLRLRGLPFSVTVQDVLAFFAQHDVADRIVDGPGAAQLLPKGNGRPSGQAVVQMRSRADAEFACCRLSRQLIGQRYIEVFVYGGDEGEGDKAAFGQETNTAASSGVGVTPGVATLPAGAWPQQAQQMDFSTPWNALPWAGVCPPPPVPNAAGGATAMPGVDPNADDKMAGLFGFLSAWQGQERAVAAATGGLLPGAMAAQEGGVSGQVQPWGMPAAPSLPEAPARSTLQV